MDKAEKKYKPYQQVERKRVENVDSYFSKRLKDIIQDNDITQNKLSEEINLTPQIISAYVKGKKSPSTKVLIEIADYFNTTPDYLLGYSDIEDATIRKDMDSFNKFTGLSESSIKRLIDWNKNRTLNEMPNRMTTIFNQLISDENVPPLHASLGNLRYFVEDYQIQKRTYDTQDENPIIYTGIDENGEEFTYTRPVTRDDLDIIKENIELYIWKASKDFSNFLEAAIKQELGEDIFNDLKSREYSVPIFR